ncbi:hypothetical protein C5Y97_05210 [Blastopirellula marina]|uniref:Uncharacterized protein n=1 Tax=Blastopirellula marina TaxID=124 RepID=A0A2S8G944_9BACT|nr:hypothetical protein C5Y98_05210 [Blastopirellula marina]PTL45861.1 hypothetical protein C5Y97_05210 [Blastopirellula marina]
MWKSFPRTNQPSAPWVAQVKFRVDDRTIVRTMGLHVWKNLVGLFPRRHEEGDGRQFPANQAAADRPLRFLVAKKRAAIQSSYEHGPDLEFPP